MCYFGWGRHPGVWWQLTQYSCPGKFQGQKAWWAHSQWVVLIAFFVYFLVIFLVVNPQVTINILN